MLGVTVLSPHRDDAAFSMCLALSRWSKLHLPITVVNFFTISAYAPRTTETAISDISTVREKEDRRALALIQPRIRQEALGLLDAPIRLNISATSISARENERLVTAAEIESLASRVHTYVARTFVFAPLALGNHIDHRAVRAAAIEGGALQRLGFYEDLPYATWTSDEELRARVADTERATGVPLRPVIVRSGAAVATKMRVVRAYQSQIGREEAKAIARYSARYGGERIWIPRHGSLWRTLN